MVVISTVISSAMYSSDNNEKYFKGKKEKISAIPGSKLIINIAKLFSGIITIGGILSNSFFLVKFHEGNHLIQLSGVFVLVVGLIIFVIAKLELGESYTPCFNSYVPKEFVKEGIYKYIRHPIYTANLTMIFSALLISGSILMLPIFIALLVIYRRTCILEEGILSKKFKGYTDYLQVTGRFLPKLN